MSISSYLKLHKYIPSYTTAIRQSIFCRGGNYFRFLTTNKHNSYEKPEINYKIGNLIEGYRIQKITPIKELNLIVIELDHERTGAKHVHISADDSNNAFSVSFKTPVTDDTGIAHILEHIVLCGSHKYPVHDPFFKMSLRSVSTFMNAMTFPDHTTYPFSSVNKKDFNNLLSVYLDCVFNPCLRRSDFLQEAWRIEPHDKNQSDSSLIFKGVVFNEMKGALNSPDSVHDLEFTRNLLPKSYSANYGGNPLKIIDLTYEKLVDFHHQFYTLSNSLFITYGNTLMEDNLKIINEIISQINNDPIITNNNDQIVLPKEITWNSPKNIQNYIPFDPLQPTDKQSIVTVGFKLDTSNYNRDIFLLSVLSQLLLIGPNSSFHKFLLSKNLGTDYCDNVGLNTYTKDPTFAIGLKGIKDTDISQIEDIIMSTLEYVKKNGFKSNHILGVIKETELAIKHISTNTGINYVTSLPTRWAHGYNPSDSMLVKHHLDYLSQNFKNDIFEQIITNNFLNNTHKLCLHSKPDLEYIDKLNQQEYYLLEQIKSTINTPSQFKNIDNNNTKIEDPNIVDKILPKITLDDLNQQIPFYISEHHIIGDETPLQTSCQPTNGLTYVRMSINTNVVPLLLRPYLPLFSHIITEIGANQLSHEQMAEIISLNSSPYEATPNVKVSLKDVNNYDKCLLFTSYCPYENTTKMMEIWCNIFKKPLITNDEHMNILISEYINNQLSSVVDNAHSYAMLRANSHLNKPSEYKELIFGWSQVEFCQYLLDLINNTNDGIDLICDKLLTLASYLFDRSKLSCFVICEEEFLTQIMDIMNNFISDIPTNLLGPYPVSSTSTSLTNIKHIKEFICLPSRVNYNAMSYRIPHFLDPDFPIFKVLSILATSKFLLPQIREIGGAYGAGAVINDGCFSFFSYRDPNVAKTFHNFEECIQWLINRKYDVRAFDEAKVKAIGNVFTPIPPSKRTLSLFTKGITNEHIINYRDIIKNCQSEDIERISKMYFCENNDYNISKILPFKSSTSMGENYDTIRDDTSWIINTKYSNQNKNSKKN